MRRRTPVAPEPSQSTMHLAAWRNPRTERRVAVCLLVAVSCVALATALTEEVNRDEHMYLAASALVDGHRIYQDFAFLQTPYAVGLYHGFAALVPGEWILLEGRLLKALAGIGLVLLLFANLRHLGARPLLAAGLVLLVFQDDLLREMVGLARNYDFAQLCILGALLCLPLDRIEGRPATRFFLAGALATAAIGFKLTYAPLALVVLAWSLARAGAGRPRALGALAAGAVAGLLPVVLTMAGTDPSALRFNLLDYHFLNAEFHVREGYQPHATVLDRAARGLGVILAPDHRPLIGMTLAAGLLGIAPRARPGFRRAAPGLALVLAFLAAAALMGVVPRPLQAFYFAPVLIGLTLLTAALVRGTPTGGGRALLALCFVFAVVDVATHAGRALDLGRAALDPASWTPVRVHRAGREIARALENRPAGPVATTHPIYALEAGRAIYPELGAAEFAWRSGSLLGADDRRRLRVAAGDDLERLFRERPPAAVLVEDGAPWDGPLQDWAEARGWELHRTGAVALRFWIP